MKTIKSLTLALCLLFAICLFPRDTLALSAPSAPTTLTATAESSSQIYLDWNTVDGATSYYVYRSTTASGTYYKIATTSSSRYTDTDLAEETRYYYKVKAVNSGGNSDFSVREYATTYAEDTSGTLEAPKNLTATAERSGGIYLEWSSVSGATSYYVYRSTTSSGTYAKIGTTSSLKYRDTDLEADTRYYYKIKAVNSKGNSDFSAREYATSYASDKSDTLEAPEDLTATAESSGEIYLEWNSVSGATSYYVYRSTTSSGTYDKIATTSSLKYRDTDLEADTRYYYKIKAVNSGGNSDFSAREYATTYASDKSGTLEAPEDLTATAKSSAEIYLDWDSVSGATSYYIYSTTSSSGTYNQIATTTSVNYRDKNLNADTTYYYKVKAVNSSGKSAYSSRVYATTYNSNNSGLAAPEALTAAARSSAEIYLDWDSVSGAASYYVYRSASSSGTYSKIATVTTSDYTDSGLSADTTYYYKVVAVDGSDTSPYSDKAQGTTAKSGETPSVPSGQIQTQRLAGQDKYGTCAEVAKAGWNTSYYALIVSGENFTDALCSAPLAQKYNAPLLLTSRDTLSPETEKELSRLKVKKVIIIGGSGVISAGIEQRIKDMGIGVSRIAGDDRYDTSIKIAQAMGQFDQAVIASGDTFPDALSIAPIAAMKGMPILLTAKDALPTNIEAYLLRTVKSTYVVGGTGVISDNVLRQLPSPKRLSGVTLYETNVSIIEEFAKDLDFSTCYLSTGENYADALAGSALASLTNSPVILVRNPVDPSTGDLVRSKMTSIKKEIVFGGTVVVPDSVLGDIHKAPDKADLPPAPAEITATALSSTEISLSWSPVKKATSYYLYAATSSAGTYTQIAKVTSTNYVNTGLWADTTYYYKVKAVNSAGESDYSPLDHAKTTKQDH